jgi:hypothetical protein
MPQDAPVASASFEVDVCMATFGRGESSGAASDKADTCFAVPRIPASRMISS